MTTYHRRWASAGAASAGTSTARGVTASIEPHTYGTSWNSVRWNKPLGNRGHSNRLLAAFESTSKGLSNYSPSSAGRYSSQPPKSRLTDTGSVGPLVLERNARFGGSKGSSDSPTPSYRTPLKRASWAPDTTSRRWSQLNSYLPSRTSKEGSVASARDSYTPSRYSSVEKAAKTSSTPSRLPDSYITHSALSPIPLTTAERSSLQSATPRADRPWRQRLADAARLRSTHGDEIGGAISSTIAATRARRGSIASQQGSDELQSSLNALKSLVDNTTTGSSLYRRESRQSSTDMPLSKGENSTLRGITSCFIPALEGYSVSYRQLVKPREPYMSRSYSPIRSKDPLFSPASSRYSSLSRDLSPRISSFPRQSSNESILDASRSLALGLPKSATIRESSRESSVRRKLSRSERTARHRSRQRSQTQESSNSTSGAEERAESRERKLRKKRHKKKVPSPAARGGEILNGTHTKAGSSSSLRQDAKNKESPLAIAANNRQPVVSDSVTSYKTPNQSERRSASAQHQRGTPSVEIANPISNALLTKEEEKEERAEKVKETHVADMGRDASNDMNDTDRSTLNESPKPKKKLFAFARKKRLSSGDEKSTKPRKETKKVAKDKQKAESTSRKVVDEGDSLADGIIRVPIEQPAADSEVTLPGEEKDSQHLSQKFIVANKKPISADELSESVNEGYSAIAHFTPGKKQKSPAPVPGIWSGPQHEMNISHNKHIHRAETENNVSDVVAILKAFSFAELSPIYIRIPKPKKVLKEIGVNAILQMFPAREEIAIKKALRSVATSSTIVQKPKKSPSVVLNVSFAFDCKWKGKEKEKATVKLKPQCKLRAVNSLSLKQLKYTSVALEESFVKPSVMGASCGAQVIVLSASITGKNFYCVRRRVRAILGERQSMPSLSALINEQTQIINAEKRRLSQAAADLEAKSTTSLNSKEKTDSLASTVLEQLRTSDVPPLWKRNARPEREYSQRQLILPDQSVLEDCFEKKHNHPKRLHSEPPAFDSSDPRNSPCLSTASELIPACAVRVLEPTRDIPFITAPSRSRLSSVESGRVTPSSCEKNMLDLLSCGEQMLSAGVHGLESTPVNGKPRSASLTKPLLVFDPPLSPFEEKMQQQAQLLRRSSVASNLSVFSEGDASNHRVTPVLDVTMQLPTNGRTRLPSADSTSLVSVPGITCNFEAAAAAASQPRHERYAAHIPVNRKESNGRQSTASVDSVKSGTLDKPSRQLDQMIDHARYRHHQHRSKFKEAIDYLDQIFEDLKKECDSPTIAQTRRFPSEAEVDKRQSHQAQAVTMKAPLSKLNVQPSPNSSNGRQLPYIETKCVLETSSSRQPLPSTAAHYPAAAPQTTGATAISKIPKVPSGNKSPLEKIHSFQPTSGDIDVTETIVLPSPEKKLKGDRLDFTRKWLAGDIKSWASAQPKPDALLGGLEEEPSDFDFDERSVGSCSAEVAAINSVDRKKRKNGEETDAFPNIVTSSKPSRRGDGISKYEPRKKVPTIPIKPQPLRPQPVYSFPTSSNSTSNFNSFPQPFRDSNTRGQSQDYFNGNQYPVKRVSSHNQIVADQKRYCEPLSWRSSSQEAYISLGSVRSEESSVGRSNGAFAQYNPGNSLARNSLNRLSDSNTTSRYQQSASHPDPILAIDALVAELELNTDEATTAEKRRSFPIGINPATNMVSDYEQPISSRQLTNGNSNKFGNSNSIDRGIRRMQQNSKASFDEMATILQNAAGDICSSGRQRNNDRNLNSGTVLSPFETINQERLNPSKVEAIQSMFESKQGAPLWRRGIKHGRHPSREEDTYYEINEFSIAKNESSSPLHRTVTVKTQSPPAVVMRGYSQQRNPAVSQTHDFVPAFPVTQPPPHPPSSAHSSQTGGYYSSGSSLGAPSSYASQQQFSLSRSSGRRGSLVGKQSVSSRAASFEDEDDGFYDNIQVDERRFSRGSELDSASLSSHRLPQSTKSGTRLGQFFRKIGASKPPGSAASLMSLNKVAAENSASRASMKKSNSLSNEPWNSQIIRGTANLQEQVISGSDDKRVGIGKRLKNSIFGSKKRLN